MEANITIRPAQDSITPLLFAVEQALSDGNAGKALAHDFEQFTQRHLRRRDATHGNPMGGKRSHYWGNAADSTYATFTGNDTIRVAIGQVGVGLHYHGGTVVPKVRKWLAIPARTETYGKSPLEFSGEEIKFVVPRGRDHGWIEQVGRRLTSMGAKGERKTIRGTRQYANQALVLWWLVKKATIHADQSCLPSESDYQQQADETVNRIWNALQAGRKTIAIGEI